MNYSIYAESTPNPEVMKFVANRMLVDKSIEITKVEQAKDISIAKALLNFPFVKSLYLSSNFISIAKTENVEWDMIAMQLRIFIADFLNEEGLKKALERNGPCYIAFPVYNYSNTMWKQVDGENQKEDTL